MVEDLDIVGIDIGEGKDKSVATLFKIGENGEYRPIAVCDTISFGSDVEHSGNVGVEAGELSFSAEVVPYCHDALCALFGWDYVQPLIDYYESSFVSRKRRKRRKRRKTTYRTIRRDCAKRNRGK